MQNINHAAAPTVELTLTRFEAPLEVDLERFFEFSFDLAEDLLDMESRFKTRASAPSDRHRLPDRQINPLV